MVGAELGSDHGIGICPDAFRGRLRKRIAKYAKPVAAVVAA
jgi:hypothetical protein